MESPDDFDVLAVQRALVGTRFGGHLRQFATVESTNTLLMAEAAAGAADGTVYLADEQTAGRGRGGHSWHSAPGDGLYVSALVRAALPMREALWISLATGLAAQAAIREASGLHADIRWPNDLLLETGRGSRKLGGILVETALDGEALRYAVIGVGINTRHAALPADVAATATSLSRETGRAIGHSAVLVALLRALDLELAQMESGRRDLLERFTAGSSWVRGKRVTVPEAGGYTGTTDGLNADGFLQVLDDNGTLRTVLSGGVREA